MVENVRAREKEERRNKRAEFPPIAEYPILILNVTGNGRNKQASEKKYVVVRKTRARHFVMRIRRPPDRRKPKTCKGESRKQENNNLMTDGIDIEINEH